MNILRIAAFSQGSQGGNPAGVILIEQMPSDAEMARVAAEVGYSETAFATPLDGTHQNWRVRYFSPESEVPFCGHATIALGAAIGQAHGAGVYALKLNNADISVDVQANDEGMVATLSSPPTHSRAIEASELGEVMSLFDLTKQDLDKRLAPGYIHAGANHIVLPLKSRDRLAQMDYNLDDGRQLMRKLDLVTIMLVYIEADQKFAVRNAFASGGVFEDPATGAAAAAFAGYLRDQAWPHGGEFVISQGEDMGYPSVINVSLNDEQGASVSVSGLTRAIE